MTSYKPGQVSALLFADTKKSAHKNNNLAKLFSVKSSTCVKAPTGFPGDHMTEVTNGSDSSRPKVKRKKVREAGGESSQKQVTVKKGENSSEITTAFPYKNESLSQQKHVTPERPQKRKLDKIQDEDNDKSVKRPRRNRIRDKQADSRTVFVGNCPLSTDKKVLKKLFREFGEIETVRFRCAPSADPSLPKRATVIMKNFHEQCSNFVSYVVFKEEEAARAALVRNGYLLDGLHLRVDIAALSKKHDKKRSVFVGNLPFTVTEEVVRAHFSDCGDITNVRIVRDRETNLGKGICYVQFESKDSVGLALKFNKTEVQGRQIRVMVCTNKPKKKEEQGKKQTKLSVKSGKSASKKITFAPSNVTASKFQSILKTKKEKRFRKMKKKKENNRKQDGLASIFGDMPVASKKVNLKPKKMDQSAKYSFKPVGKNTKVHHKGGSLKGKGNSFNGKGKGNSFKGKGKGNSFRGKGKGNSFRGKGKNVKNKH